MCLLPLWLFSNTTLPIKIRFAPRLKEGNLILKAKSSSQVTSTSWCCQWTKVGYLCTMLLQQAPSTQFKVPTVMRVIHGKVCWKVSSHGVSNHCTMEKGNMNHEVDFGGSWKLQPVGHSPNFFCHLERAIIMGSELRMDSLNNWLLFVRMQLDVALIPTLRRT